MSFFLSVIKPLAYASLPLILVRQLAVSSMVGRYYARVVVYVGTLMTVASCSVIIAVGMTIVGRSNDVNYYVARVFYTLISKALDLSIVVEGEENLKDRPAVLMVNHQSMLDVFVIGRLMPKQTVIMSKKSLQFTPLGPFMTMSGTIFIDRGNSIRARKSVDDAIQRMKRERSSLWMFPEGTRHMSKEASLLPLKKGGFHMAINAGFPIIPIVTQNYWSIYRKNIFNSGVIKVRVLPAIHTTGLVIADVATLTTRVHNAMLECLIDLEEPSAEKHPQLASQEPSTASGPFEGAANLVAPSPSTQETLEVELQSKGSSSSLASSSISSSAFRKGGSEQGGETEEDEGMILVGRP